MSRPQLNSPRVLSSTSGDFVKDVANSNVKEETDTSQPSALGATEPPLPLTPERLELIKAYAASRKRGADEAGASRIAQRFAPRGAAEPPSISAQTQPATPARPTSPLVAWASGIRTLTAVLVIAALLPNVVLAVFWLRMVDPPWSEAALPPEAGPKPQPKESARLEAQPEILSPVLSAPVTLEAPEGGTVTLPIALDGTDAVPDRSFIVIKGLPRGSTLSAGSAFGEAEWRLDPNEIGDLHLALADAGTAESKLLVELVTPDKGIIATTSMTLRTMANPKRESFPYGLEAAQNVNQTAAAEIAVPQAGSEETSSIAENASVDTASVETVPLPDRRPEATATDDANATWIRPTAWVNLREGPSSTAQVLSIVPKGTKLRVLGRKRGWVKVNNPATSQSGWIYASNIASVR